MASFRQAVDDCRFTDLGYSRLPYTWDNRQEGERNVKVRLDRALGDDKFMESMGATSVQHIQLTESDHCALLVKLISWQEDAEGGEARRSKPFRYENMSQRHDKYMEFVQETWDPGVGGHDLQGVASS